MNARADAAAILEFFEVPTGDAFDVAPEDALKFFQAKGLKATFSFADMMDAGAQAPDSVILVLDLVGAFGEGAGGVAHDPDFLLVLGASGGEGLQRETIGAQTPGPSGRQQGFALLRGPCLGFGLGHGTAGIELLLVFGDVLGPFGVGQRQHHVHVFEAPAELGHHVADRQVAVATGGCPQPGEVVCRLLENDVDRAPDAVGIHRRAGAAHDLDALDHVGRQAVHLELAIFGGGRHRLTIDEEKRVALVQAAQADVLDHPRRPAEGHAGQPPQHIAHGGIAEALDLRLVEHQPGHGCQAALSLRRPLGFTGHDDRGQGAHRRAGRLGGTCLGLKCRCTGKENERCCCCTRRESRHDDIGLGSCTGWQTLAGAGRREGGRGMDHRNSSHLNCKQESFAMTVIQRPFGDGQCHRDGRGCAGAIP